MEGIQKLIFMVTDGYLLIMNKETVNEKLRNYYALKEAPELSIDENLIERMRKEPHQKLPYVIMRGIVTAIDRPLYVSSVLGVMQRTRNVEYLMVRDFFGFWNEEQIIHSSSKEVPFRIVNGQHSVDILEGLSAKFVDMDTVYRDYQPSSYKPYEQLFSVHPKGEQRTVELLRNGSFVTVAGELQLVNNRLRLQPPTNGAPMLIKTATKNALLHDIDSPQSSDFVSAAIEWMVLLSIVWWIVRKFLKRNSSRPELRCIVCTERPKQVFFRPCGHVCLCKDCADRYRSTNERCPVCRATIESQDRVYVA